MNDLLSILSPDACILCGETLPDAERGTVFCGDCAHAYEKLRDGICMSCGRIHTLCRCVPDALSGINVKLLHVFGYKSPLSRMLIYSLKRKKSLSLIRFISHEMACAAYAEITGGVLSDVSPADGFRDYVITYIPRAPRGIRIYGFDQAKYMCNRIAEELNIEKAVCFRHTGRTRDQKNLNSAERKRNADKSYMPVQTDCLAGKNLIIVDDVVTSGNTVRRCTELAVKAGIKQIMILCAARTE